MHFYGSREAQIFSERSGARFGAAFGGRTFLENLHYKAPYQNFQSEIGHSAVWQRKLRLAESAARRDGSRPSATRDKALTMTAHGRAHKENEPLRKGLTMKGLTVEVDRQVARVGKRRAGSDVLVGRDRIPQEAQVQPTGRVKKYLIKGRPANERNRPGAAEWACRGNKLPYKEELGGVFCILSSPFGAITANLGPSRPRQIS